MESWFSFHVWNLRWAGNRILLLTNNHLDTVKKRRRCWLSRHGARAPVIPHTDPPPRGLTVFLRGSAFSNCFPPQVRSLAFQLPLPVCVQVIEMSGKNSHYSAVEPWRLKASGRRSEPTAEEAAVSVILGFLAAETLQPFSEALPYHFRARGKGVVATPPPERYNDMKVNTKKK